MNAIDWVRVEELFHEAQTLEGGERASLLASQPDEIRQKVESLLQYAGQGERIARTVSAAAVLVGRPPDQVGPYRLVREIGQGGMGAVYLARRADNLYEKQVAIKFVRGSMDSPALRRRFEEERRILARLEHPNIAGLMDGGATPEGLPYLVMEYIEGETITSYAQRCGLSVCERVSLFRHVCAAVQYAHQNLVIHRDLKPANVLIDSGGNPKLLDFGIAKLTGPENPAPGQTLVRVLTPEYASPEQVRGDTVTTATDIYSLGALLFELLVGHPPAAAEQSNLQGDLDNILRKAMRELPEERYTSAAEFSADLERFLNGLPVTARDYTVWQRGAKFVARHRMGMLAAAAVVASIVTGAALATRFAIRANHERQIADRRLVEQEQVLRSFLEGFYRDIRTLTGATPARKRMLDSSLRELERLRQERPDDRAILATLALGYQEMGRLLGDTVESSLSDPAAGKRLLHQAAGLYEDLHRGDPAQISHVLGLSAVYRNVAKMEADTSRDPAAGFDAAGQAVAWGRAALALAPQRLDAQDALCHALLTRFQLGIGRDISRMHLEDVAEVRRIVEPLAAAQPDKPEYLTLLADSYAAEFQYYRMRLDYAAALPRIEKALDLYQQTSSLLPNDTTVLRTLMNSYNGVADLYPTGTPSLVSVERATEYYERAAAISERLALGDPADRNAQYQLALGIVRLAGFYQRRGDADTALRRAEQGIRIFRGLRREIEQNLMWRSAFIGSLLVYEDICRSVGHSDAVEPALREALREALSGAEKNQRPENFLRSASLAAEGLASWTAPRDADEALAYAEQSVQYAERARAIPGAGPFTILRLGQARGQAALLYARRHDEASRARARALAEQSLAVIGELTEPQMANWPKVTRESIRALTVH